jgi:DNA polymerase-3 subunit epsilon/CBS domain-containing protein
MPSILANTPLSALEAVVLDTETTGLEVSAARIVEIGLWGLRLDLDWSRLVHPGQPIPAGAAAVHGIDDAAVADAAPFREVWPEAEALIGPRIVLGHSLGFDMAILRRECLAAGLPWREPPWLDTRLLALLVDARLPDFSLSALAHWLGLPPHGAHRALADAKATAAVFEALVPRLRQRGVHTVGEALAACRRIGSMAEELVRAGWSGPAAAQLPDGPEFVSGRIDAEPFRRRVVDLMSSPPLFVSPAEPLSAALRTLADKRISALFVGDPDAPPESIGIVTERDVLRALARDGAPALDRPVGDYASRPVLTVPEGAYAYRAVARMARANIRHLAVTGEDDPRITGALSQRDLLRLRAQSAAILGDGVDTAGSVAALGQVWARLPAVARALTDEGLPAHEIAGVVAREVGALTRRAAVLAEERMAAAGRGPPPARYAMLALGSVGRGESLLAMDQDNAIVFAEGAPGEAADLWFAELGRQAADILHEVGVPYCKGGVMAREAGFRGSVETWLERLRVWLSRSDPADLLNVDIVFDARTVHGDPRLMQDLLARFREGAAGNPAFLKLMIASHRHAAPPIGLFGGLKGDADGRIDLKKHVLSGMVAAARVLALRSGRPERGTLARLAAAEAEGRGSPAELRRMGAAFRLAQQLVLRAQLADIAAGRTPDNRVPLALVAPGEKTALKEALSLAAVLEEIVRSAAF